MTDVSDGKQDGLVIKVVGGLYTVESPGGIYECHARGLFRNMGISPCTGDIVSFSQNLITEITPRKNFLVRPPLANLDQILFVVSTCKPAPNLLILDKFIAISEYKNIKPVLVITKVDLCSHQEIVDIYHYAGIHIMIVDYSDKGSVQAVCDALANKISALTGNSGVGKSTLLNAIEPSLNIPTGEISEKLGRGRHTTRHAQLYQLDNGGYIADTPGFSTFETNKYDIIKKEMLADCFIEFARYTDMCRFSDCSHTKEKGCAIIQAVHDGEISESRHKNYCLMYEEAKNIKDWEL